MRKRNRNKGKSLIATRIITNKKWKLKVLAFVYVDGLSIEKVSKKTNLTILEIEKLLLYEMLHEKVDLLTVNTYRQRWISLCENNESLSLSEIKKINFPLYAFLIRNDLKWLYSNSPFKNARRPIDFHSHIEWCKRDTQVLLYLKEILKIQYYKMILTVSLK